MELKRHIPRQLKRNISLFTPKGQVCSRRPKSTKCCLKYMYQVKKKCHVVLFTFTQTLYYHLWLLMWQTGWLSDVFFCQKRWWFKATGSAAACGFWLFGFHLTPEAIVISFSWQMVLGYLGLNRWISWQSNLFDHLGCISETFTKPYN